MTHPTQAWKLRLAQAAWFSLILLTICWDGIFKPLNTGWFLLLIKLLPLCLPLKGITSGKIYTYQYCSMLILAYFSEGVMRAWDTTLISRLFALGEIALSVLFFISCLMYLKQFKIRKTA